MDSATFRIDIGLQMKVLNCTLIVRATLCLAVERIVKVIGFSIIGQVVGQTLIFDLI
jgi:hypothetical protein